MLDRAYKYNFSIKDILECIKYKRKFRKQNPEYFDYDGIILFHGDQGQGKTYTAVLMADKLLTAYPKCKLVTNIKLRDYPVVSLREFYDIEENNTYLSTFLIDNTKEDIIEKLETQINGGTALDYESTKLWDYYVKNNRIFYFDSINSLSMYSNGYEGVIFLIDEITFYINCKDSSNTELDYLVQISTQRKQRKCILATTQVFRELDITIRSKFKAVVACRNILGMIQKNSIIFRSDLSDTVDKNGSSIIADKAYRSIFTQNPNYFSAYDTSEIVAYKHYQGKRGKI